jgi:hypothetical protein
MTAKLKEIKDELRRRMQGVNTSHSGAAHVAFDRANGLGPCIVVPFVAQPHAPHGCCVRFVTVVAGGSGNTHYRAAR